jgi:hypothetical protein
LFPSLIERYCSYQVFEKTSGLNRIKAKIHDESGQKAILKLKYHYTSTRYMIRKGTYKLLRELFEIQTFLPSLELVGIVFASVSLHSKCIDP